MLFKEISLIYLYTGKWEGITIRRTRTKLVLVLILLLLFIGAASAQTVGISGSVTTNSPYNYEDSNGATIDVEFSISSDIDVDYDVYVRGFQRATGSHTGDTTQSTTYTESIDIDGGADIPIKVEIYDDTQSYDSDSVAIDFNQPSAPSITVNSAPSDETVSSGGSATKSWDWGVTPDIDHSIDGTTRLDVDGSLAYESVYNGDEGSQSYSHSDSYDGGTYPWEITAEQEYYYDGTQTESTTESGSFTITEESPANFDVTIDSTNSPVTAGNNLEVTGTIHNTGDESDTQTITLSWGGASCDSASISLSGGQSTTETLSCSTGSGDAGDYTAELSSSDNSDSTSITIEPDITFNSFTPSDSATGVSRDTSLATDITEGNGNDVAVTFYWGNDTEIGRVPPSGYTGDGEFTKGLDSDLEYGTTYNWYTVAENEHGGTKTSGTKSFTTESAPPDPANFQVSITGTNSPVTEGETLEVTASIDNTGDESDTQTISLDVLGEACDSTSVSLNGGASTSETLTCGTSDGDAGTHTATVSSSDDSDSTSITVEEYTAPANFSVDITSFDWEVTEGDTATFTADIENTGDESGTQTVELYYEDESTVDDSTSVSLNGGQSTTETFSYTTQDGDAGTRQFTVQSENDSDTVGVTVNAPAEFNVSILSTNDPVTEGEQLVVETQVENVGDEPGEQDVDLEFNTQVVDTAAITLDSGGSTTENLTYTTQSGDAGSQSITVQSEDDTASSTVTVEELRSDEASFALRSPFNGATFEEDNTVTFDVGVTADFAGDVHIVVDGNSAFNDTYNGSGITADYTYSSTFSPDTHTWYAQLVESDGTIHNSSEQGFSVVSSTSNDDSGSTGGLPSSSSDDDDDEEILVRFADTQLSAPYESKIERSFVIENYGRESTTVTLERNDESPGCEYVMIQESVDGDAFGSGGEYTLRPSTDVITDAYVERVAVRIDMPNADTFADTAEDGKLRCGFETSATNGGIEDLTVTVEPGRDVFAVIDEWVSARTDIVLFKERTQCLDVETLLQDGPEACPDDEVLTHRWPTRFTWSVLFLLLLVAGGSWMVRRYY
ncbi:CARDB domain-containing protein [Natrinema salinisoli]|uniref:CARDB domain-containing protein n=1 Tax=Natrinema salinisoli TaxID=2878535 RepID=UPI001CEFFBB2|nr:CARDB domain-containing protein [Natrinema salinisoli]